MKVLVAHNFYQQPGGEDEVFAAEVALLEMYGHAPVRFVVHNDRIDAMSRLKLIGATLWNRQIQDELRDVLRRERPDVVHFHNTFPLISPAAYSTARAQGAAVVQTLHNYRLLCPNGLFYRDGKPCESCAGHSVPWPSVVHACYRGSRPATAVVAAMLTTHRALGTYERGVDMYIALTESSRRKFVAGGLPAAKIVVKPNFVHPDPGIGTGTGGYAVFVGRLSQEKGINTLLGAWKILNGAIPLKIIGDGPLADDVRHAAATDSSIHQVGRKPLAEVYDLIGDAAVLIQPSECYETFGRVAVEAFAKGTPVIAAGHGAMADVVDHGRTGRLFHPGDCDDLAATVTAPFADRAALDATRPVARAEFEAKYTGEQNYRELMAIYRTAIANAGHKLTEEPVAATPTRSTEIA